MAQLLLVVGASIFGVLGIIHLTYTFFSDKFSPTDSEACDSMKRSSIVLTNKMTVWDAWIGFNASHSLGAILVAAVYVPLALSHFYLIQSSVWFEILPILMGLSYLFLAKRYWFNVPFVGVLLATICFICGAFLTHVR